jgi:amino acid permease
MTFKIIKRLFAIIALVQSFAGGAAEFADAIYDIREVS